MAAFDEAAEALARIAKSGDDWGWKGGKPGELTGGNFIRTFLMGENIPSRISGRAIAARDKEVIKIAEDALAARGIDWKRHPYYQDMEDDLVDSLYQFVNPAYKKAYNQMVGSSNKYFSDEIKANPLLLPGYMRKFKSLEDNGVPRKYTAKVFQVLQDNVGWENGSTVITLLRPMTDAQRETFLTLLPRWTGTLEQAANAAKKLYRR